MKSIEIKAELRKETGKKSTIEIRSRGAVPCVMYGGEENIHFTARSHDIHQIIYTHDVYMINLNLNGKQYKAILKDAQFHPVTDEPIHLDFIEILEDKPAIIALPITLTGSSVGLKAGGKLRQRRRYLKVKGLLKDLPESLDIDITELNIGDFVKVGDLKYPNLEILDPVRAMVVGVAASRISKGMEEGISEVAEAEAEAEAETGEGAEAEDKTEKTEKSEKAEKTEKAEKAESPPGD